MLFKSIDRRSSVFRFLGLSTNLWLELIPWSARLRSQRIRQEVILSTSTSLILEWKEFLAAGQLVIPTLSRVMMKAPAWEVKLLMARTEWEIYRQHLPTTMPNSSISCWKVQEITQMMSLLPWSTSLGLTDVPSRDQEPVSRDSQTSVIHTRTNTRLADYRRATGEAELTLNKCTFHFMLNSPAYDIFQLSRCLDLIQGQGGNLFIPSNAWIPFYARFRADQFVATSLTAIMRNVEWPHVGKFQVKSPGELEDG